MPSKAEQYGTLRTYLAKKFEDKIGLIKAQQSTCFSKSGLCFQQ